jgi:putative intracellular protease/amidase
VKRLRLAADQRKIILGHAEERGRFTAGRLLAVKAVTDGDERGIGIELEFDCAACALSRVLLCHMVSFPFQLEKRLSGIAPSGAATRGPWLPISAVKIAPERPKEPTMKVLMVLTSHDQLGDTGRKTGFWLEELAAPYYVFKDARAQITLASPKGGRPPLDPKSQDPSFQTDITRRFEKDADAEGQLDKTVRLESVEQEDYDTVFYPGGHGPMWDLAEDPNSVKLIEAFLAAGKPVALVCHAPGVLRHVKTPAGKPLVDGKNVTGFTNGEEADVGLTKVVPFLVEDELLGLGAIYSKVKDWGVHTVKDGLLITGQNPASSGPAAKVLIDTLKAR